MNQLQVTRCRHAELHQETEIPTEALPAWQARGWEPISDSRSLEDIHTENYMAEVTAGVVQEQAEELAEEVPVLTVVLVLEEVGDDPVKAAAALEAEQATAHPRSTLVAGLQKVIDAAEPAPDPDPGSDPVADETPGADGAGNTEAGQSGDTEGN